MGEVSILGFKKAQVFCIKNSSCVKTGKSLRAIATSLKGSKLPPEVCEVYPDSCENR